MFAHYILRFRTKLSGTGGEENVLRYPIQTHESTAAAPKPAWKIYLSLCVGSIRKRPACSWYEAFS